MRSLAVWVIVMSMAPVGLAQDSLTQSLIQGAWSGQRSAVEGAIASGRVNVNVTTPEGNTPLMLASLAGHDGVIDLLIEGGADPNLVNDAGETGLILASKYGFNSVAAKLIEAGAELNSQDSSSRTAWTWANWGENESLLALLKASGADGSGAADPFASGGAPVDRFETRPELKKYRPPKMPKELKKSGVEGRMELRLVVDRDAKPKSVELVEGVHDALDQNALKAAEKWRFEPGEVQGKEVDSVVRIFIEYKPGGEPEGRVTTSTRRWRN